MLTIRKQKERSSRSLLLVSEMLPVGYPACMEPVADSERLEACPRLARAFALLGKRWTALILDILVQRPARFAEIHRAIPNLSERLLSERLQELIVAGVVERQSGTGGTTRYALSSSGELLAPALDALRKWAGELDPETGMHDSSSNPAPGRMSG